jgi:exodeoxyribonuclease V alpha subunit
MARASTASSTEVLAGLVERVAFHNDENGFCVLRVKARCQRDLITVLGRAAMIAAGEFVQASGSWVNDRIHGVQLKASFLEATAPTTTDGIEKYLGSGMNPRHRAGLRQEARPRFRRRRVRHHPAGA